MKNRNHVNTQSKEEQNRPCSANQIIKHQEIEAIWQCDPLDRCSLKTFPLSPVLYPGNTRLWKDNWLSDLISLFPHAGNLTDAANKCSREAPQELHVPPVQPDSTEELTRVS